MKKRELKQHECVVSHDDGRVVHACVVGVRDFKRVIFYSHGFPASRLEVVIAHESAQKLGLTIVALDRPGFGGSQWYRGRCLEDWAQDVVLVANHLGVERFGILGVSGGSPTAIAAAGELKERVTTLSVVSGVSPVQDRRVLSGMNLANQFLLRLGGVVPGLGKGVITIIAALWRLNPIVAQLWFRMLLPEADIAIGRRPEVSRVMVRAIREGLRQGVQGAANDFELLLSDWRYLVERIRVPSHVWHGDADTYVPLGMGQLLARDIPGAVFHKVEGGGHFMIVDRLMEILETASARS